jgi:hypothetical protein
MKFTRADYQNRIIDLAGKIPENEPCFLLRGKDILAVPLITQYIELLHNNAADRSLIALSNATLQSIKKYQNENIDLVTFPDSAQDDGFKHWTKADADDEISGKYYASCVQIERLENRVKELEKMLDDYLSSDPV